MKKIRQFIIDISFLTMIVSFAVFFFSLIFGWIGDYTAYCGVVCFFSFTVYFISANSFLTPDERYIESLKKERGWYDEDEEAEK